MNLTNEQIEQISDGAPANDWTHYCTRNRQYFKRDGNTDRLFVWLGVTKTWSIPLENKVRWLERRERLEEILTLRQRVAELEAQVPKWISVEDELPPIGQECLFFRPLAENSNDKPIAVKVARHDQGQCWESTVPYGFVPCNPSDGCCHVTHWMPLPTPPKWGKKMSEFDPTRDCKHGHQKGKCDSCDLAQAEKIIEQQQQRIAELEQRNNELSVTVERLRFISETEYADEDERIADIQGVLEQTPPQNLNAVKRDVAEAAIKTALYNFGEGSLSEQDILAFAAYCANKSYPSGEDGE